MILSSSWRISQLIDRKNETQHRLRAITLELEDLRAYGRNIADGGISIGELMKVPTSMYNRQLQYMNSAAQYAQLSATNQMNALMQTPYYQNMMAQYDPQVQQSYAAMMQQSYFNEAKKQFSKFEENLIHEKETIMEQEKQTLLEEMDAIKGELNSAKEENKSSIQEFFGGGRG